jgi:O-Antigen ligase
MTVSVAEFRARRRHPSLTSAELAEQLTQRRVGIAWGLLFLNALTFYPGVSFLHIPSFLGKGIAQAAMPVALLVLLSVNRKLIIRPNILLFLVTLLVVGAFITTLQPQHFGTIYRTFRLAGFVVALWLLTPWWGRRDLLLVKCHLKVLAVLIGSVLIGLLVAPGRSRQGGRLIGSLWPMPATQVAHYAAVATGLVIVLWFCGQMRGRTTLLTVVVTIPILILTHTRTALVGLVAGILVAGMSLIIAKPRVRRLFAAAGAVMAIAIVTLSGFITTWLARGEGTQQLTNLTGRTTVWSAILTTPRDKFEELFGFGLSNSSFNGLPIDSNWLASYQEQGLFGVALCAIMLLFLLVTAYFQPRSAQRALALFLITYCLLASFTEVGFTDVSPYLLELTLAASLIAPPVEVHVPE